MGLFHPKPRISTSIEIGTHAEMAIIERLMKYGYIVLAPYGGGRRYDLVIEDADGQFWRVQCKAGRRVISKGQTHIVGLEWNLDVFRYQTRGRPRKQVPYRDGEIDYFAVYYPDTKSVYLVPLTHVAHFKRRGYLQLRATGRNYAEGDAPLVAEDYEI